MTVRIHQEDICQALGVMPTRKYQNDGGPGVAEIVDLLRAQSDAREEDIQTFVDAVAFYWLICGPDAHAKNYSLLIGMGPRVRLAPLYDLASILPYDLSRLHKVKLAMKLGGEYQLREIGVRHWRRLADEVKLDPDVIIARAADMADRLPDEVVSVRKKAKQEGLSSPVIDRRPGRT
jgi:serine/threonine-protein kinase HipA